MPQRTRALGPHVARPFATGLGVGTDGSADGLVLRDLVACTRGGLRSVQIADRPGGPGGAAPVRGVLRAGRDRLDRAPWPTGWPTPGSAPAEIEPARRRPAADALPHARGRGRHRRQVARRARLGHHGRDDRRGAAGRGRPTPSSTWPARAVVPRPPAGLDGRDDPLPAAALPLRRRRPPAPVRDERPVRRARVPFQSRRQSRCSTSTTVAKPPIPRIEVADYIEMGRLVAQWATEPATRPRDVDELKDAARRHRRRARPDQDRRVRAEHARPPGPAPAGRRR